MKYLSILGRQPEFGLLELESVLGQPAVARWGHSAALLLTQPDIHRLGGSQKIGRVIYRGPAGDLLDIELDLPRTSRKLTFGLSYYGLSATKAFVTAVGVELKKRLRTGGPTRFVAPSQGTFLSAAQITHNHLLKNGFELLVAVKSQEMVVAVTTAVQDIESYSKRDYGRPVRDAKVGMLPPKLAQIMINTVNSDMICDPFCGTGVVLQEALLMGKSASGSDLAAGMTAAARQNLQWLQTERGELPSWEVQPGDAREIKIPPGCAVVTEGYLGENQTAKPNDQMYRKLKKEAEALYYTALKQWAGQLPPGGQVTIAAPVWQTASGWRGTDIIDSLPDLGYSLRSFAHVDSAKLIYRRPGQIVGRQLLTLIRR